MVVVHSFCWKIGIPSNLNTIQLNPGADVLRVFLHSAKDHEKREMCKGKWWPCAYTALRNKDINMNINVVMNTYGGRLGVTLIPWSSYHSPCMLHACYLSSLFSITDLCFLV